MRRRAFFWGLVAGSLIYPVTDISLKFALGRTLLHPDH